MHVVYIQPSESQHSLHRSGVSQGVARIDDLLIPDRGGQIGGHSGGGEQNGQNDQCQLDSLHETLLDCVFGTNLPKLGNRVL